MTRAAKHSGRRRRTAVALMVAAMSLGAVVGAATQGALTVNAGVGSNNNDGDGKGGTYMTNAVPPGQGAILAGSAGELTVGNRT